MIATGCGCLMMLTMFFASVAVVVTNAMDCDGHTYGWMIAFACAANIWFFRYVFVEEGRSQWPAESNRGARLALNASLCALAIQNPVTFDWLYRRMYPPQASAFVGWALVLSLSIVAVAFSLRVLAVQVHYRGNYMGTAVLSSALSCWAAILAFGLIREAAR